MYRLVGSAQLRDRVRQAQRGNSKSSRDSLPGVETLPRTGGPEIG